MAAQIMEWKIDYLEEEGIVVSKVTGPSPDEGLAWLKSQEQPADRKNLIFRQKEQALTCNLDSDNLCVYYIKVAVHTRRPDKTGGLESGKVPSRNYHPRNGQNTHLLVADTQT